MRTFDCVVIGLGAMGGAACYHLASRGARVLGIDRFEIGHDRGSSHGQTRIIRKAYFEHPDYVPLLHRAYELWRLLESASDRRLFVETGLLMIGRAESELIAGVRRCAREHRLDVRDVPRAELANRFPGFAIGDEHVTLHEAAAGYLRVEECVRTHVEQAVAAGAVIETGLAVTAWSADKSGVVVETERERYAAAQLVIAGGAWTSRLLRETGLPLTVLRKVQLWFPTRDAVYDESRGGPAFCYADGDGFFYGFPSIAPGEIKVAEHTGGEAVSDPAALDRTLHRSDVERVASFVSRRMPGARPEVLRHSVCLYTMTPDANFIVDRHPQHANVTIAAGFSGHGFKFAPIVGSTLADLALDGVTREPIGFLSLNRTSLRAPPPPPHAGVSGSPASTRDVRVS